MNERITELMIQAGKTIPGDKHIDADFCEKFAELIVRECIEVIDSRNSKQFHPTSICGELLYNVAKDVKQHFGVES